MRLFKAMPSLLSAFVLVLAVAACSDSRSPTEPVSFETQTSEATSTGESGEEAAAEEPEGSEEGEDSSEDEGDPEGDPEGNNGQEKVDICHRDGKGRYRLINVAVPSVTLTAHLKHGDGYAGGDVPDQPGKTFDEECNIIEPPPPIVTCPCDFSNPGLDFDIQSESCTDTTVLLLFVDDTTFHVTDLIFELDESNDTCSAMAQQDGVSQRDSTAAGLSTEEEAVCRSDLLDTASDFGLSCT